MGCGGVKRKIKELETQGVGNVAASATTNKVGSSEPDAGASVKDAIHAMEEKIGSTTVEAIPFAVRKRDSLRTDCDLPALEKSILSEMDVQLTQLTSVEPPVVVVKQSPIKAMEKQFEHLQSIDEAVCEKICQKKKAFEVAEEHMTTVSSHEDGGKDDAKDHAHIDMESMPKVKEVVESFEKKKPSSLNLEATPFSPRKREKRNSGDVDLAAVERTILTEADIILNSLALKDPKETAHKAPTLQSPLESNVTPVEEACEVICSKRRISELAKLFERQNQTQEHDASDARSDRKHSDSKETVTEKTAHESQLKETLTSTISISKLLDNRNRATQHTSLSLHDPEGFHSKTHFTVSKDTWDNKASLSESDQQEYLEICEITTDGFANVTNLAETDRTTSKKIALIDRSTLSKTAVEKFSYVEQQPHETRLSEDMKDRTSSSIYEDVVIVQTHSSKVRDKRGISSQKATSETPRQPTDRDASVAIDIKLCPLSDEMKPTDLDKSKFESHTAIDPKSTSAIPGNFPNSGEFSDEIGTIPPKFDISRQSVDRNFSGLSTTKTKIITTIDQKSASTICESDIDLRDCSEVLTYHSNVPCKEEKAPIEHFSAMSRQISGMVTSEQDVTREKIFTTIDRKVTNRSNIVHHQFTDVRKHVVDVPSEQHSDRTITSDKLLQEIDEKPSSLADDKKQTQETTSVATNKKLPSETTAHSEDASRHFTDIQDKTESPLPLHIQYAKSDVHALDKRIGVQEEEGEKITNLQYFGKDLSKLDATPEKLTLLIDQKSIYKPDTSKITSPTEYASEAGMEISSTFPPLLEKDIMKLDSIEGKDYKSVDQKSISTTQQGIAHSKDFTDFAQPTDVKDKKTQIEMEAPNREMDRITKKKQEETTLSSTDNVTKRQEDEIFRQYSDGDFSVGNKYLREDAIKAEPSSEIHGQYYGRSVFGLEGVAGHIEMKFYPQTTHKREESNAPLSNLGFFTTYDTIEVKSMEPRSESLGQNSASEIAGLVPIKKGHTTFDTKSVVAKSEKDVLLEPVKVVRDRTFATIDGLSYSTSTKNISHLDDGRKETKVLHKEEKSSMCFDLGENKEARTFEGTSADSDDHYKRETNLISSEILRKYFDDTAFDSKTVEDRSFASKAISQKSAFASEAEEIVQTSLRKERTLSKYEGSTLKYSEMETLSTELNIGSETHQALQDFIRKEPSQIVLPTTTHQDSEKEDPSEIRLFEGSKQDSNISLISTTTSEMQRDVKPIAAKHEESVSRGITSRVNETLDRLTSISNETKSSLLIAKPQFEGNSEATPAYKTDKYLPLDENSSLQVQTSSPRPTEIVDIKCSEKTKTSVKLRDVKSPLELFDGEDTKDSPKDSEPEEVLKITDKPKSSVSVKPSEQPSSFAVLTEPEQSEISKSESDDDGDKEMSDLGSKLSFPDPSFRKLPEVSDRKFSDKPKTTVKSITGLSPLKTLDSEETKPFNEVKPTQESPKVGDPGEVLKTTDIPKSPASVKPTEQSCSLTISPTPKKSEISDGESDDESSKEMSDPRRKPPFSDPYSHKLPEVSERKISDKPKIPVENITGLSPQKTFDSEETKPTYEVKPTQESTKFGENREMFQTTHKPKSPVSVKSTEQPSSLTISPKHDQSEISESDSDDDSCKEMPTPRRTMSYHDPSSRKLPEVSDKQISGKPKTPVENITGLSPQKTFDSEETKPFDEVMATQDSHKNSEPVEVLKTTDKPKSPVSVKPTEQPSSFTILPEPEQSEISESESHDDGIKETPDSRNKLSFPDPSSRKLPEVSDRKLSDKPKTPVESITGLSLLKTLDSEETKPFNEVKPTQESPKVGDPGEVLKTTDTPKSPASIKPTEQPSSITIYPKHEQSEISDGESDDESSKEMSDPRRKLSFPDPPSHKLPEVSDRKLSDKPKTPLENITGLSPLKTRDSEETKPFDEVKPTQDSPKDEISESESDDDGSKKLPDPRRKLTSSDPSSYQLPEVSDRNISDKPKTPVENSTGLSPQETLDSEETKPFDEVKPTIGSPKDGESVGGLKITNKPKSPTGFKPTEHPSSLTISPKPEQLKISESESDDDGSKKLPDLRRKLSFPDPSSHKLPEVSDRKLSDKPKTPVEYCTGLSPQKTFISEETKPFDEVKPKQDSPKYDEPGEVLKTIDKPKSPASVNPTQQPISLIISPRPEQSEISEVESDDDSSKKMLDQRSKLSFPIPSSHKLPQDSDRKLSDKPKMPVEYISGLSPQKTLDSEETKPFDEVKPTQDSPKYGEPGEVITVADKPKSPASVNPTQQPSSLTISPRPEQSDYSEGESEDDSSKEMPDPRSKLSFPVPSSHKLPEVSDKPKTTAENITGLSPQNTLDYEDTKPYDVVKPTQDSSKDSEPGEVITVSDKPKSPASVNPTQQPSSLTISPRPEQSEISEGESEDDSSKEMPDPRSKLSFPDPSSHKLPEVSDKSKTTVEIITGLSPQKTLDYEDTKPYDVVKPIQDSSKDGEPGEVIIVSDKLKSPASIKPTEQPSSLIISPKPEQSESSEGESDDESSKELLDPRRKLSFPDPSPHKLPEVSEKPKTSVENITGLSPQKTLDYEDTKPYDVVKPIQDSPKEGEPGEVITVSGKLKSPASVKPVEHPSSLTISPKPEQSEISESESDDDGSKKLPDPRRKLSFPDLSSHKLPGVSDRKLSGKPKTPVEYMTGLSPQKTLGSEETKPFDAVKPSKDSPKDGEPGEVITVSDKPKSPASIKPTEQPSSLTISPKPEQSENSEGESDDDSSKELLDPRRKLTSSDPSSYQLPEVSDRKLSDKPKTPVENSTGLSPQETLGSEETKPFDTVKPTQDSPKDGEPGEVLHTTDKPIPPASLKTTKQPSSLTISPKPEQSENSEGESDDDSSKEMPDPRRKLSFPDPSSHKLPEVSDRKLSDKPETTVENMTGLSSQKTLGSEETKPFDAVNPTQDSPKDGEPRGVLKTTDKLKSLASVKPTEQPSSLTVSPILEQSEIFESESDDDSSKEMPDLRRKLSLPHPSSHKLPEVSDRKLSDKQKTPVEYSTGLSPQTTLGSEETKPFDEVKPTAGSLRDSESEEGLKTTDKPKSPASVKPTGYPSSLTISPKPDQSEISESESDDDRSNDMHDPKRKLSLPDPSSHKLPES
uniref:Uncharacterized protein n=1 Tax=Stomoxys calcitrans TaxID=35570 RepID=A0A1I8NZE1_STOCA